MFKSEISYGFKNVSHKYKKLAHIWILLISEEVRFNLLHDCLAPVSEMFCLEKKSMITYNFQNNSHIYFRHCNAEGIQAKLLHIKERLLTKKITYLHM